MHIVRIVFQEPAANILGQARLVALRIDERSEDIDVMISLYGESTFSLFYSRPARLRASHSGAVARFHPRQLFSFPPLAYSAKSILRENVVGMG